MPHYLSRKSGGVVVCACGFCPPNNLNVTTTGSVCAFSCVEAQSGPQWVSGVVDFTGGHDLDYFAGVGGADYFILVSTGLPITSFIDALCAGGSQIREMTYIYSIRCNDAPDENGDHLYISLVIGDNISGALFYVFRDVVFEFGVEFEVETICGTYTILVTNPE